MARIARVVIPGVPHHITQRGNRKQITFFRSSDYDSYKGFLTEWCRRFDVEIWAYCLMPNHVHLIAVPPRPEALARAIGETHRHYSLYIHKRFGWSGYLWQGRFASTPMDEVHVFQAARYVLLNPVRAGLVSKATDWDYSSARAHQTGVSDGVCNLDPLAIRIEKWDAFLKEDLDSVDHDRLRMHTRTGRPLGSEAFVLQLEATLGIRLRPKRSGPKSSK